MSYNVYVKSPDGGIIVDMLTFYHAEALEAARTYKKAFDGCHVIIVENKTVVCESNIIASF